MVVYESFVNDCIEGCDIERIKKLSESIDNLDPFSEERDAFATAVLGGSIQLSIDGDGRVILPETLLKKIKAKSEITFVGKGSTFEIWEPKKFEEYMAQAKKDAKTKRNLLKVIK
jgi:MraZ protein